MTDDYFTKTDLKDRGWTEAAIKRFAPNCDLERHNPRFKRAAPMKLYAIERIKSIEKTDAFKEWLEAREVRKVAARKATETKKQKLLAELESWSIVIDDVLPLDQVRKRAIRSYNERHWDNGSASMSSDSKFLDRITVNYLRHEQSNYEMKLDHLFGKVGKDEAYLVLFMKILTTIGDTYPELQKECSRQIVRRT